MLDNSIFKIADANAVGELLRAYIFKNHNENEFGCYTTFVFRDDATLMTWVERHDFWYGTVDDECLDECADLGAGCHFKLLDCEITCCYYWDGDGVLAFKIEFPDRTVRYLENNDCKKNYKWTQYAG